MFECAGLPSVDTLGTEDPPSRCNTDEHTVSERTCVPNSTVVGYMGGQGDFPNYATVRLYVWCPCPEARPFFIASKSRSTNVMTPPHQYDLD